MSSQTLGYVFRSLRRSPGFTAVVVIILALGIGANTAIYSLFDAVVLRPLPVAAPERLVEVETAWSYLDYLDFRNQSADVFSSFSAFSTRDDMRLGKGGSVELIAGSLVSTNFFDALGLRPAAGRFFGPADARQPTAVIGYELWQRAFDGDPGVVGRTITLNRQDLSVIGVAPRRFHGISLSSNPQVWLPLEAAPLMNPGPTADMPLTARDYTWLRLIGRLKPGVSAERAQVALDMLNRQLLREYPDVPRESEVHLLSVTSTALGLKNEETLRKFIWVLALMVGLVLLVACANVAGLQLARAARGRKELAVRLALGAGRRHLVAQLLLESLVLAVAGGLAGLLVATALLRVIASFQLPGRIVIGTLGLGIDGQMLGFTLLLSAAAGILFGLVPAAQASRPDLMSILREQVPGQSSSRVRLRDLFVVIQLAFCLVLLIGGGLFLKSLRNALTGDVGFNPDRVAFVSVNLRLQDYETARAETFYRQAVERVRSLPGVEGVAWANLMPFRRARIEDLTVQGYAPAEGEDSSVMINYVTPGYFQAMGLTVLRGRTLGEQDRAGAPLVAFVNSVLAERYWPGDNPVGRRISLNGGESWAEVTGVIENSKYRSLSEPETTYIYLPLQQNMDAAGLDEMNLLVRTAQPPQMVPLLPRELAQLDADLPVLRARTLREQMGDVLMPQRMGATLLGGFSVLAVVLAVVGLYGLLSYLVSMRTHEIGVRMALGAQRRSILRMILLRSLSPVVLGIGAGLLAAYWATRLITGFLYGVSGLDPQTFVLMALLLAVVAMAACCVPALRASRVNPTVALKRL